MTTQPTPGKAAPPPPSLDKELLARFRSALRGQLVTPADADYEQARRVYNGMIDRRPAAVVRCADVADVMAGVNFARQQKLSVAIRGGAHNPNGFATCDGGIVIDLSHMRSVHVDPDRRVARVEGGATWGDYDHATHAFGLASPGGIVSTTGVGGLTLGGGIGHLSRAFGLSIDNLKSADVVLADGQFVTADANNHQDLFWALRGGGGNYGVVTSFEFGLHPVDTVLGGPILYPLEKLRDVLRFYRTFLDSAPEALNAFFAILLVPPSPHFPAHLHHKRLCGLVVCHVGDIDAGQKAIEPLRKVVTPVLDLCGPMPFPALQSLFDPLLPPGMLHYWKADFVHEITDAAIDEHVKHAPGVPTPSSVMHIYPTSGTVHRVGKNDTAYSYRDAKFVHVIAAMYSNPADTQKNVAWVREYWNALHPHSAGGAYVNFMMDEPAGRLRATYRDNYDRLVEIKKRLDPTNLFRLNQNIAPGG